MRCTSSIARQWNGSAYNVADHSAKLVFHRAGMAQLRALAKALGLAPGTYDVRSNKAGMAVSGEVTLHGERVYIQLSHGGFSPGIMYRTCDGRRDYSGGRNNFAPLSALDDIEAFARRLAREL
jgi:hypothetical protein